MGISGNAEGKLDGKGTEQRKASGKEVTLFENRARLGGLGKVGQINVSKIGKSK